MALSHTCLSCGFDLARTRAAIDHALGLPIVTCPHCGWSCVRRRHPLVVAWRQSNRLRTTLAALFLQLLISMTLIWSLGFLSMQFTNQMQSGHTSLWSSLVDAFDIETNARRRTAFSPQTVYSSEQVGPFGAAVWLSFSALAGVWLGSCFSHWKRWATILLWPLALALFSATDTIAWLLTKPIMTLTAHPSPYDAKGWSYWVTLAPVLAASVGITTLFVPLGALTQRVYRIVCRQQSRKHLNRRRRIRIES